MISFLVKMVFCSYSWQNAGEPIEPSKIFTPVFEKLEGYAEGIVGGGWLWVGSFVKSKSPCQAKQRHTSARSPVLATTRPRLILFPLSVLVLSLFLAELNVQAPSLRNLSHPAPSPPSLPLT